MKTISLIILSTLFTLQALALPIGYFESRKQEQLQLLGGLPLIKAGVLNQKVDHASSDMRVFKQRYWTTTHYAKGSSAPVILFVCGEGACGGGATRSVAFAASSLGANVVALEHRYYGESQPFADLSIANLKHLTVTHAVADIIELKKVVSEKLNWNGEWLAAGGSYAGALAAYTRLLHPNEFVGALASSAPVVPTESLTAYDEHLARSIEPACVLNIQKTLGVIESRVGSAAGLQEMFTKFSVTKNISRADDFLYLLADVASAAIQMGYKQEFCQQLETR